MTKLTIDRAGFNQVLGLVDQQVFEGKGFQRHGNGTDLKDQIWFTISQNVGEGFCLGQAMKKIHELSTKKGSLQAWNTEILGAMSYLVFAFLWFNMEHSQDQIPSPKE